MNRRIYEFALRHRILFMKHHGSKPHWFPECNTTIRSRLSTPVCSPFPVKACSLSKQTYDLTVMIVYNAQEMILHCNVFV